MEIYNSEKIKACFQEVNSGNQAKFYKKYAKNKGKKTAIIDFPFKHNKSRDCMIAVKTQN